MRNGAESSNLFLQTTQTPAASLNLSEYCMKSDPKLIKVVHFPTPLNVL